MILLHKISNTFLPVRRLIKILLIFILTQCSWAIAEDDDELPPVEIKHVIDFSQLAAQARTENKIIMLEVSATDCEFCELLEEEFIKPMLRNADYTDNVLIRKIDMDSTHLIKNLAGDKTTASELTQNLKVQLTPTLLFFDGYGNEVSPRILGINSLDLYGGYLDDALETGLKKIREP